MLVVLLIALIVFGPKRLPEVGRTVGKGLREFRRATDEIRGEIQSTMQDDEPAEEDAEDDEPFISFGSSVGLQRELADLAGMLQQANVPAQSPVARCLQVMRTAADQSVANELPIIVW